VGVTGNASKQDIVCMLLSIFRQGEGGVGGAWQASKYLVLLSNFQQGKGGREQTYADFRAVMADKPS